MSRIGKLPITIPIGVSITVNSENVITVKGKLGEMNRQIHPAISLNQEDGTLVFTRPSDEKNHRALHGLSRALVFNMVHGVSEGYMIKQELVGVGYRAEATGQQLKLALGYSHDFIIELPKEIKIETVSERGKNPIITMTCCDKELIGQVAAKIRSLRKPEPYKGKGIKFVGEILRRKAGKSAKK